MDKKELKFYEAPEMELVDLELEAPMLTSSATESISGDEAEEEIDY